MPLTAGPSRMWTESPACSTPTMGRPGRSPASVPAISATIDELTGYVRIGYPDTGLLYRTADGGKTWNRTAASPGKSIRFANPEIGWAFHYGKLSFTTSGGTAWTSRTFSFPGRVTRSAFPAGIAPMSRAPMAWSTAKALSRSVIQPRVCWTIAGRCGASRRKLDGNHGPFGGRSVGSSKQRSHRCAGPEGTWASVTKYGQ